MARRKEFSVEKVLSPRFVDIYRVAVRRTWGVKMETLELGGKVDSPTVKVQIFGKDRKRQSLEDKVNIVSQRVAGSVKSLNPIYWYPVYRIRKEHGK